MVEDLNNEIKDPIFSLHQNNPFQATGIARVFSIFFTRHRGQPQMKQELTLDHSQRPIASCGSNQGEPNISPSRILPGLLHDTLCSRIGRTMPALYQSRCSKRSISTSTDCTTALPLRLSTLRVSSDLPPLPSMVGGDVPPLPSMAGDDILLPSLCFLTVIFPQLMQYHAAL
jgi:hypothetical protein